jgi:hypothetical protein
VSSLNKIEPALLEESKVVSYQKKDLPEHLQFKRGGKGKKMVKVETNAGTDTNPITPTA